MFNSRHTRIARRIALMAADLWMSDKLSSRNVRSGIRTIVDDPELDSGGFRTTLLLKNVAIKVPHHIDAIRSTIVEYRFFEVVKKNRKIAMHFPHSSLVTQYGMPVLLQERVPMVATQEIADDHPLAHIYHNTFENPVHTAVEKFARKLGLGDTHYGNYGWKKHRKGFYPVFFDCEVAPRLTDYKLSQIEHVARKNVSWGFGV